MAGATSLFEHDNAGTVGPHDVYYLKYFACGQPSCPSLFSTRAKAPWGIQASSAERLGEWHNHPAWSWSRRYAPLNGWSPYYEYTCEAESCRKNNTYIHNPYWDDTAWIGGGGSGGSGGDTCNGPCPKFSPGDQPTGRRRAGAELRWDFAEGRSPALSGNATAAAVSVADEEWGYSGGQVRALRIAGQGEVRLALEGPFDTGRFSQVIARVRRAKGRLATITAEWAESGTGLAQSGALARDHLASRGWEILVLPLSELPAWTQLGSVDRVTLTLQLDGGPGDAVDLDFVVLAP
jgi:hypothetical protein